MTETIVAIVGRPNVGKSRLFNRLTGKYQALVDDQPGVTRDRHYGVADWRGKSFWVVDTGGLIPGAEEPLSKKVWEQAFLAIQEADLIICLFDGIAGVTPLDQALVQELRRVGKPVHYVVNKIDNAGQEKYLHEFSRLGCHPLFGVSSEHGRGISDLLEALYEKMPGQGLSGDEKVSDTSFRLSIVGRPNVGKSTLFNHLAGAERVIVHEEAGTTRDAINVSVHRNDKDYLFVDTAGFKRKKQTKTRLDKFSVMTALRAIEQSQCVLYLLDATEGLTHNDAHLLNLIWQNQKGLLILVNKWDLMKASAKKYEEELRPQLRELHSSPILCISAAEGKSCGRIWGEIDKIAKGLGRRFSTSVLNGWLEEMESSHPLPLYRGRTVKLFYGTQVGVNPPHIVLFTNAPQGIPPTYKRYLFHQFAERMEIEGVPIRFSFRLRK